MSAYSWLTFLFHDHTHWDRILEKLKIVQNLALQNFGYLFTLFRPKRETANQLPFVIISKQNILIIYLVGKVALFLEFWVLHQSVAY